MRESCKLFALKHMTYQFHRNYLWFVKIDCIIKTNTMKTTIKTIILLILGIAIFASCRKERDDYDPNIPQILPPAESMLMDFSNFKVNYKKSTAQEAASTVENWTACALTVSLWNTMINENSSLPIAAYKEAFNYPDVYVSNTTRVRSYPILSNGVSYHCKLESTIDSKSYSTKWKMYVSKFAEDGSSYTDFVWFTGTSSSDGSSAVWRLNRDPEVNGRPYLDISWVKNSSHKYTLVDKTDAGEGNFIEYRKINDAGMDAQFIIQTVNHSSDLMIQWDTKNRNGRVRSQHWYNNLNWQCWGENYLNLNCK